MEELEVSIQTEAGEEICTVTLSAEDHAAIIRHFVHEAITAALNKQ